MKTRTAAKLSGALLGGLALVAGSAAHADAATLAFSTAGMGDPGYANAGMTVTFPTKYRLQGTAWVNKICPENGKVAELRITVVFKDGSAARTVVSDTRRCTGTGRVSYNISHTWSKRVMGTIARLCERDAVNNGPLVNCTRKRLLDNPHTA